MRPISLIFPLFLICIISFKSYSQSGLDSTNNFVEITGFGSSTERTPFWIQSNQFGIVPRSSPAGSARVGLEHFWKLSKNESSNWSAGFGVEAVGNLSEKTEFILPQAHATLRYKKFEFFIGRKKRVVGLADSTLGTGSYIQSGNAVPIPKIQVGTVGFVNLPLTKGWLAFQGFYSDGLFDSGRPVTSGLKLHQKSLYLRIGKETSGLKLYGGFNHQVQWGGKSQYFSGPDNKLPDGFKNYLNVVTGKRAASGNNFTHFDSTNRVGNHLGSLDVALEIETFGSTIFLYRQFLYDDGSLFYLKGLTDGLNGVRIRRKNSYGANFEIQEAVLEFLYTKDQAGDSFVINDGKQRGIDNYFNNQQIRDGWSYNQRTIGTPFIPPSRDTYWKWPNYADNFTSNNRVMVLHLGLQGSLFQVVKWYTKLSYSSNSGAYLAPFEGTPKQFSGLIGLQTKINVLGGMTAKGSVAADTGDLYPKTYGFTLGLRKDFSF